MRTLTVGSGRRSPHSPCPPRARHNVAMTTFDATMLWTPDGWRQDARLQWTGGRITGVDDAPRRVDGSWCVPGIANLHSHAFQRAMAGMAERQTDAADSFWTWRETMYR